MQMANNISHPLSSVFVIVVLFKLVVSMPLIDDDNSMLDLILLHNNDMHARFEQTDQFSGNCKIEDEQGNKCYGGFARVSHVIKKYRQEAANGGPAVLYLNAGDTYSGTPWFNTFKYQVVSEFMNILKPDAMSLGNHEFDNGFDGLLPFLNDAKFPMLASNINATADHPLWETRSLRRSTMLEIKGFMIGVIGYVTTDTIVFDKRINFELIPEVDAINSEADKLKTGGADFIFALGHSGYSVDQKIAQNCPLVDLVIGGHSHTFLYSGQQPDVENIEGPYPTIVSQNSGKKVPVVQAYAFTKYLGKLQLTFDRKDGLIAWSGAPILLSSAIPQDPDVLALENSYKSQLGSILARVLGVSKVHLDGVCRKTECNMGNMITDAFVRTRVKQHNGTYFTDASIALIPSGLIRTSAKRGEIAQVDLGTILPFENQLLAVNITGDVFRLVLEQSARRYDYKTGYGEFLQMSGVHVIYNMTKPAGNRVESVKVLTADSLRPFYTDLESDRSYGIILPSFMFEGGDGYYMFKDSEPQDMNVSSIDAVQEYIQSMHILYPAIEGRIQIIK